MVIVLVSCMPGWGPALVQKLLSLRSAMSIQSLRRNIRSLMTGGFLRTIRSLMTGGFFQCKHPRAAPKHVIEALEVVQYSDGTFCDDPNACCAICLGDFEQGDELRRLPCHHQQFHAACVDHWLSKAGRCPLCLASVLEMTDTKE